MQKYWILVGSDCRKEEVGGATLTPIYVDRADGNLPAAAPPYLI